MNLKQITLFVGPYPPPIDGHSFAFKTIYDNYQGKKYLFNQNIREKNFRFLNGGLILFNYFKFFFRNSIGLVYIAGSRSLYGSLKDIILIRLFKLRDTKIILHIHAANFDIFIDDLPFFIKQFYIKTYKKVDVFITLLDQMKPEYSLFLKHSKVITVENFYDRSFDESNLELPKNRIGQKITLVYFSNLIYSKGIILLLEAFETLSKKYKNLDLNIAGAFATDKFMNKDKIKKIVYEFLERNPNINYVGVVSGEEKKKILTHSDIFVLPTFYSSEAFPISIIEAMRCSCCIITTDHHYLKYIIKSENGMCIEKKSVTSIISAVEYYLNNPCVLHNIQTLNQTFALKKYTQHMHVQKLSEIIQEELTGGNSFN